MNFYHYSAKPFTLDKTQAYPQAAGDFKPQGLWLSVEDDSEESFGWKQWCEGEDFFLDGLANRAQVVLCADARLLLIDNVAALDAFTAEYKLVGALAILRSIDWPRVAERYDGIVIAPYMWERRLTPHTFWYYAWDCASACVWNASMIEVIRQEALA